jgi:hypothetical protein
MKARRIGSGFFFAVVALVVAALFYAGSQKPLLELGVGYGARVACGCRYIGNRSLADCRKDFEPGMEVIRLSEDAETKTITASVPLITRRSVRFDPVLGCQPEKINR